MLHLVTTLSIEILSVVVDLMYWFVKHLSVSWTRLCVFCNSTSLSSLLWWNKLYLMYILFRPLCLPAVAIFTKLFGIWNFFTRIIKYKQILSSVVGKIFNQVKIYSLKKFKVFSLHLTMKRLIILIKVPTFNQSKIRWDFPDPLGPTKDIKICSLLDLILFIAL